MHNELIAILGGQKLTPHFQPIVSLSHKKIIGYEALIRGPYNSPLHRSSDLFAAAEHFNLSTKLEFICRKVAVNRYVDLNIKEKLFINVSPTVLLQPEFKKGETLRYLKRAGVDPRSVVIELTENQPTDDYDLLYEAVNHYRNMGFEIALDDLGAGYSGLRLWSELLPDYVKIDKHFIQKLHKNPVKLNFVKSILNMATTLNCKVIAEGIETIDEFRAIEKIGIAYAQGYYFGRPLANPIKKLDSSLFATNPTGYCEPNLCNMREASCLAS